MTAPHVLERREYNFRHVGEISTHAYIPRVLQSTELVPIVCNLADFCLPSRVFASLPARP